MSLFYDEQDRAHEQAVKQRLEQAWNCSIHFFGPAQPIDGYAAREAGVVAWFELKCRNVPKDKYPTIYLSFRKWRDLVLTELHTDCPSIFVVDFSDALCYCNIRDVDARNIRILGRNDRGAPNDLEPIIEVPISSLKQIN